MFCRTIFVCLAGLVLVKLVKMDLMKITFKLSYEKRNNHSLLKCDHNDDNKYKNKYTVLEGEDFKIHTIHNTFMNYFICDAYKDDQQHFYYTPPYKRNLTTFQAEKRMGTLWNCTVLTNKGVPGILPIINYINGNYTAAYCYMKIHVRQKKSPQTILVNNAVLKPVRANLSEQAIDFVAEYQYADNELVNVTCANFLNTKPLTMEYAMADKLSDKFKCADLSSYSGVGFIAKLHSEHNNTTMICTNTESTDYTKVLVRFIMRASSNKIKIRINGMIVKQKIEKPMNNFYAIDYKYLSKQNLDVLCEVERSDLILKVLAEEKIIKKACNYTKTELIPNEKYAISFYNKPGTEDQFRCAADYNSGGVAEIVEIRFSAGDKIQDPHQLHMQLPSNGTVMEVYSSDKLKVIFYEFEVDETLTLNCYRLFPHDMLGAVVYLQLNDSEKQKSGAISKTFKLTKQHENDVVACQLKEEAPKNSHNIDEVIREIRVILREKVQTTTKIDPSTEPSNEGNDDSRWLIMVVAISGVACIIILCMSILIMKLRKKNLSQGPFNRNYENLSSPSEASIPTSPPQWNSEYAVPKDRKAEDTTYSVPFQPTPADLYAAPIPKSERKKSQQIEPTYASLDVQNNKSRKNTFKETNDPTYAEVYANRDEKCYAKVVPKSIRRKNGGDNSPYANVTKESPYANTVEPEPMYCELNTASKTQGGQYANLNNARYVNSPTQEYVEPTYCEPQGLKK